MSGFYKPTSTFFDDLKNRRQVLIEINPDGGGKSLARGLFVPKSDKQTGKVGGLEDESISYALHVPDNDQLGEPYGWYHAPNSTLNAGIRTVLSAWQTGSLVECRYEEVPPTGRQGSAVVTDVSLSGGLSSLNDFTVSLEGSGALVNS
jgi:hypothetical protein